MSRLNELIEKHRSGALDDDERREAAELALADENARKALADAGFFMHEPEDQADEDSPAAAQEASENAPSEGDFPRAKPKGAALPVRIFFLLAAILILGTVVIIPVLALESDLIEVEEGVLLHDGEQLKQVKEPMIVSVPKGQTALLKIRGGARALVQGSTQIYVSERSGHGEVLLRKGEMNLGRPTFESKSYYLAGPFEVLPGEGCELLLRVTPPTGQGAEKAGSALVEVINRNAKIRLREDQEGYVILGNDLDLLEERDDWITVREGQRYTATLTIED